MADETTLTTVATGTVPSTPVAGQGGSAEVTTAIAGTEPITPVAGQGGEGATDTTGQEGATGATEETKPNPHQKTLEERVAELAEQKIIEAEARWKAAQQAQIPDYSPPEVEAQVERNILMAEARLSNIKTEIDLSGGEVDQNLVAEYRRLKQWINGAENALQENQTKRQRAEAAMSEQQRQDAMIQAVNRDIAAASPVVAQGLGITPEAWKAGEDWFAAQRKVNPLLNAEYRERCLKEGPIRAITWAAEYVKANMGKKEEAALAAKEAAKEQLPPGKTSSGDIIIGTPELDALRARASRSTEDMAAYLAAKKQHRQAQA